MNITKEDRADDDVIIKTGNEQTIGLLLTLVLLIARKSKNICTFAECDGGVQPLTDDVRCRILETVDEINDKGFRVLAIAQKSNPSPVMKAAEFVRVIFFF